MLTVMTRNMFLGADLKPAYEALQGDPAAVPAAVASIFNPGDPPGAVQRTDFEKRAAGLAEDIAAVVPDLVALQEAAAWRTRAGDGSVTVDDHLETLEGALAARGARYRRVVTAEVGDVELPSAAGFNVGLTNRLAILARDDDDGLRLRDPRSGSFTGALPIQTPLGVVGLARGWASVDVEHDGTELRFITTHLEVAATRAGAEAQLAQADELVRGPAACAQPVVMAGDFNARPDSAGYDRIRAAGFADAWTQVNTEAADGLTCCHRMPLDDPADRLRTRIDLILLRGGPTAAEAFVVGEFGPGIWPSDHAGVVARLHTSGH